jgi:hypothetical protein
VTQRRVDTLVVGATPGGIAAAVRAAREGSETVLVARGDHVGGMMASGLSYTDTQTTKTRAPILERFVEGVRQHYLETYGPESSQYERCEDGYVFEPRVATTQFESLLEESLLTVERNRRPEHVERRNRTVGAVGFTGTNGASDLSVSADAVVDATYEGDVAALAGVPYRVGRESRAAFDEQFAGRLFTRGRSDGYYPIEAVGSEDNAVPADSRGPFDVPPECREGALDQLPHPYISAEIAAGSTGEGDDAVQAYNYRVTLTTDPANRRRPEEPPDYDRTDYLDSLGDVATAEDVRGALGVRPVPNQKADMNAADLPGENHAYPEADHERRAAIAERHRRHSLARLYFLQHDESVPEPAREEARRWGLPLDEFTDNDNFPWQLYVREARRIEGRDTFTESDGRVAPGIDRTPVHADAIAIAEYPMDSHACTTDTAPGASDEGFFFASSVTRPSQIPYRAILPRGVDNLLCPVALSATHVGFGTIRLEPTWMHVGEAAGMAAALGIDQGAPAADVDVDRLQRRLLERGHMLSYFNGFDAGSDAEWAPAVQYFGTKGFFAGYDAATEEALSVPLATAWIDAAAALAADSPPPDPTDVARSLPTSTEGTLTVSAFLDRVETALGSRFSAGTPSSVTTTGDAITRGGACRVLYEALEP